MASGTGPRQRMINMMYLVLTAMLALNVSAEILSAFETLNDSLHASTHTTALSHKAFVQAMREAIRKEVDEQHELKNAKLPDTLDLVVKQTEAMIAILDGHIAEMRKLGGTDPLTGKVLNKSETEQNLQYWMGKGGKEEQNGGRGAGKAYELHTQLDAFADFITGIYNRQPMKGADGKPLRMAPDSLRLRDPQDVGTESGQRQTWEQRAFSGPPVVANLAQLEALKIAVYSQQKLLLDHLNLRLGAVQPFVADKVVGMEAPTSAVVTAGMSFETRLFAVLTSSQLRPRFASSSGKLIESSDGTARLVIPASASAIPNGQNQGTISYSASIDIPRADGKGVEHVPIQGKFTVRKPEIVVTSAAVQNLYRGCGNTVNIDVPALGDFYNPVISASGAEVQGSKQSVKRWMIVPSGDRCVVNVKSNTNGQTIDIGNVEYRVIEPPKPTIEMKVNDKPYDGISPVQVSAKVCFQIKADEDFARSLPQDAHYEIEAVEVMLKAGLGPATTVMTETFAGKDATEHEVCVRAGNKLQQATSGAKVYYHLTAISRKNFRNAITEDKRFPPIERYKSIVVK